MEKKTDAQGIKSLRREGRFREDLKRAERRGYDLGRLFAVLKILEAGAPVPLSLRMHSLRGKWVGYSECHIAPDWLLIYKATDAEVILARTGTHADLFKE